MTQMKKIINDTGGGLIFLRDVFRAGLSQRPPRKQIFDQVWTVTLQSLPTTALAGFFVGAIMTIQFTLMLKEFGALGYLGGLATSGTVREIGPLLIAFMLSGRVGAYTSAELGTMKVTEQIDAIRCLGADPLREIIWPRFLGIIISSFFLLVVGLFMSIFGGMLLGVYFANINPQEYLGRIAQIVAWPSIMNGVFKCFVFAFVLASICTYKGYTTSGGAKGVGKSVVMTAVSTMVGIVLADWLTSLISDAAMAVALGE